MNERLKKGILWAAGAAAIAMVVGIIIYYPLPFLFPPGLPCRGLLRRAIFILLLSFLLCLMRICRGPTAPDRAVAIDIIGILIVGLCALLSIPAGRAWYLDIGIAWALQSFIGALALAKYLEGRPLDE